jgi:8-oxo-dGTP pyrophosphatase MutT (NUDIX family)
MTPAPTIAEFRAALAGHLPRKVVLEEGMTRAAVAAILRSGPNGAELLFIQRADRPDDPWAGHMAFPGGRVDPSDADPLAAAMRETREEVGLALDPERERIGRLSELRAIGRGRPLRMVICPFVFAVERSEPLATNHEVDAVVWVPVTFLLDRANRGTMPYRREGLELELPCYRFHGHLIWGMTLGMVDELLALTTT